MREEEVRKYLAPRHSESVYGIGADPTAGGGDRRRVHAQPRVLKRLGVGALKALEFQFIGLGSLVG